MHGNTPLFYSCAQQHKKIFTTTRCNDNNPSIKTIFLQCIVERGTDADPFFHLGVKGIRAGIWLKLTTNSGEILKCEVSVALDKALEFLLRASGDFQTP